MISEERFRGGATLISISADTIVFPSRFRLYSVNATGAGLKVILDDARRYAPGMPRCEVAQKFAVDNVGANSFALCNSGGTTLATIAAGEFATLSLLDYTTANGHWVVRKGTTGSAANPGPSALMFFAGGAANAKRMDQYDQTLNTWTVKSNSTNDRNEGSCSTLGGAGIYAGTDTADNRLVEHYDPDTWSAGTSMPGNAADGSSGDCCSTMASKVYTFGGVNVSLRTIEYDGATWVTKASRPAGRGYTNHVQGGFPGHDIGNAITYLLSGGNATDEGHNFVDSYIVDTYSAKTERPLPLFFGESRGKHDAGDALFVFGGAMGAGDVYTGRTTKYVGTTDVHSVATSYPVPTTELMSSSYGPKCYVGFGEDDVVPGTENGYVRTLYEFDMVLQTYTVKLAAGQAKQDHTQNQACAIAP